MLIREYEQNFNIAKEKNRSVVNASYDKQDSDDKYGTTVSDLVGAIYYQFNF